MASTLDQKKEGKKETRRIKGALKALISGNGGRMGTGILEPPTHRTQSDFIGGGLK